MLMKVIIIAAFNGICYCSATHGQPDCVAVSKLDGSKEDGVKLLSF